MASGAKSDIKGSVQRPPVADRVDGKENRRGLYESIARGNAIAEIEECARRALRTPNYPQR